MHKNRLVILISIIWLIVGIIISADEQTSSRIKIYENSNTEHFFWSADSTTLYFIDYSLVPADVVLERGVARHPAPVWVAYNVYNQTIQYSDTWFEQPEISEAAYDSLGATRRFGEQTLFFMNPDKTLYAYSQSPHDLSQLQTLGITDGNTYVSTKE